MLKHVDAGHWIIERFELPPVQYLKLNVRLKFPSKPGSREGGLERARGCSGSLRAKLLQVKLFTEYILVSSLRCLTDRKESAVLWDLPE
jgi:hypothetical protein